MTRVEDDDDKDNDDGNKHLNSRSCTSYSSPSSCSDSVVGDADRALSPDDKHSTKLSNETIFFAMISKGAVLWPEIRFDSIEYVISTCDDSGEES